MGQLGEQSDWDDTIREMALHYECMQFYNREAELLDARKLDEWLEMLTEDVTYKMPVRVTRDRTSELPEFSNRAFSFSDNRNTLEARVERFNSEFAWSEEPPSRVRHFVSNVRVTGRDGDEISVKCNLLVHRSQGDTPDSVYMSGERNDTLRRVDGELKLATRQILVDHTILPMRNLSIFF